MHAYQPESENIFALGVLVKLHNIYDELLKIDIGVTCDLEN